MQIFKQCALIILTSLSLLTLKTHGMNRFANILAKTCKSIQATTAVGIFWLISAVGCHDTHQRINTFADANAPEYTTKFYHNIFKNKGIKHPEDIAIKIPNSTMPPGMMYFNIFIAPHSPFEPIEDFENKLKQREKLISQNKYNFKCKFEKKLNEKQAIAEHEVCHKINHDIIKRIIAQTTVPVAAYVFGNKLTSSFFHKPNLPYLRPFLRIPLGLLQATLSTHIIFYYIRNMERAADRNISNSRPILEAAIKVYKKDGDPEQINWLGKILHPQIHPSGKERVAEFQRRLDTLPK